MLGIWTQGCRLVGAVETMELWRPPVILFVSFLQTFCLESIDDDECFRSMHTVSFVHIIFYNLQEKISIWPKWQKNDNIWEPWWSALPIEPQWQCDQLLEEKVANGGHDCCLTSNCQDKSHVVIGNHLRCVEGERKTFPWLVNAHAAPSSIVATHNLWGKSALIQITSEHRSRQSISSLRYTLLKVAS